MVGRTTPTAWEAAVLILKKRLTTESNVSRSSPSEKHHGSWTSTGVFHISNLASGKG